MASSLVWKHVTKAQLHEIRNPHPKRNLTSRDLLAKALGIANDGSAKNDINLDLYTHSLQFGQGLGFTEEKLSGLLGIVVATHTAAVEQRLPVTVSFSGFKSMLLRHSVQRPPWSIGLFTYKEMQTVLQWMLDTYYKHYKLYQYAFTNRVTMSVTTSHPSDVVEAPPQLVPPLQDAITEEEYLQQQSALQQEADVQKKQEDDAHAAAEEAARLAKIRAEYEAAIPDEIKEKVQSAVTKELELMQTAMDTRFKEQEAQLLAKLAELQTKVAK